MPQLNSLPPLATSVRRLRAYRLLANASAPLLVIALAVIVFRWVFPYLFSVLVYVWAAAGLLLLVLVIPWTVVLCAFALGKIRCPACGGPFASGFQLWVPRHCHTCGYDVTSAAAGGGSPKPRQPA